MAGFPVQAGTKLAKPDPLLDGGATAPCAAGTDYAAGLDTSGHAVVPADVGARPTPVPDTIAIPLASQGRRGSGRRAPGDSAYIGLDGRKLAPLINPPPCLPRAR